MSFSCSNCTFSAFAPRIATPEFALGIPLCFDISHGAEGHRICQASLQWFIYSAAKDGVQHGVSLTFTPPPLTAQPPFTVEAFCIEEAEQWLHTWFPMKPAIPPAIALGPSLLKLMRLRLDLDSWDDPPE
jgi:hypothetical protein